jgi:hypothetical protein
MIRYQDEVRKDMNFDSLETKNSIEKDEDD